MLKCKIISGTDGQTVQQNVNDFLSENPRIMVHSIHQSADRQQLYISIFYNVKNRTSRMKEASIEEIAMPVSKGAIRAN